jgi:hypothetical protein
VIFDPFGDFAAEGYLRNFEKEKDLAIVKRAENASFTTGLDEAFASLAKAKTLSYDDVLRPMASCLARSILGPGRIALRPHRS